MPQGSSQTAAALIRGAEPRRWTISVINGPNMDQLGKTNPDRYGAVRTLDDLIDAIVQFGELIGVDVVHFQSNHEGDILDYIHQSTDTTDGYLINPADHTTYGKATRAALIDSQHPWVETHFNNSPTVHSESVFCHTATAVITGFHQYSYLGGLLALVMSLDDSAFLGAKTRSATGV